MECIEDWRGFTSLLRDWCDRIQPTGLPVLSHILLISILPLSVLHLLHLPLSLIQSFPFKVCSNGIQTTRHQRDLSGRLERPKGQIVSALVWFWLRLLNNSCSSLVLLLLYLETDNPSLIRCVRSTLPVRLTVCRLHEWMNEGDDSFIYHSY